jgi:fructosamine-3-kinase
MPARHRKQSAGAPPGYFGWEAAGLRWLAAADATVRGGARVVEVLDEDPHHLDLERLTPAAPTAAAAERLGHGLAATHAAGATAYGCGPPGWVGDGWLGPLSEPLALALGAWDGWGEFYAQARIVALLPLAQARGVLDAAEVALLRRLADRVASGAFDTGEPPARLHGDLWSGNVLWTAHEAVLIDPAAHGGSREADLAMLALFGAPHLEQVLAAYDEAAPLVDGWRDRVLLHQVHPLLLHAVLFGGSYAGQALRAARRYA